jgi:hypothetical protein
VSEQVNPFLAVFLICCVVFLFGLWATKREKDLLLARRAKILETLTQRPGSTALQIGEAVGVRNIYPYLADLEHNGRIWSDWQEGKYPRRRLYWVANAR